MGNQTLDEQAWATWKRIDSLYWFEASTPNYHASFRATRLKRLSTKLYNRFLRRKPSLPLPEVDYFFVSLSEAKEKYPEIYKKNPDGFALPPVQPSGAVGQGVQLCESFE